ncbi:MAG: hypothetical protein WBN48_15485, partial [Thiogranum sp.]
SAGTGLLFLSIGGESTGANAMLLFYLHKIIFNLGMQQENDSVACRHRGQSSAFQSFHRLNDRHPDNTPNDFLNMA